MKACGPYSYAAHLAGTILGGTETTLYVLAAGLLADAAGVAASLVICRLVFR